MGLSGNRSCQEQGALSLRHWFSSPKGSLFNLEAKALPRTQPSPRPRPMGLLQVLEEQLSGEPRV